MRIGAENISSIHNGLTRAEDRLISTRWFSEKGFLAKTGGMVCRFAKHALLDLSADSRAEFMCIRLKRRDLFGRGCWFRFDN